MVANAERRLRESGPHDRGSESGCQPRRCGEIPPSVQTDLRRAFRSKQTAANFYTPFILNTANPGAGYEASDSRLGPFHALTYGLKYARKLRGLGSREESEFNVRAVYYQQTFHEQVAVPAGLQGLELYPGLKAILVQVGWRF
jgi:Protein of unknown function (DUF3570)